MAIPFGFKHSEETKKKMSETHKRLGHKPPSPLGRKHSLESIEKMRLIQKGKPKTDEHIKNMSLARKRLYREKPELKSLISLKVREALKNPEIVAKMKGRKTTEATKEKLRKANRGHIPWNKGKKLLLHSEETKKKISFALKGRRRTNEQKQKLKGRVFSFEWRKKLSEAAPKGNKHYKWRGGITPLNEKIRQSFEMHQWRNAIFKKDNFRCLDCGAKSGEKDLFNNKQKVNLEADHIYPFSKYPRLRFDINNGQTRCRNCHKKRTQAMYRAKML